VFRLDRALQPYREAGSLNDRVNLFGFIDDRVFLSKSGDVGVTLAVKGVDYEGLGAAEIDNYTKRLESAFKIFDEKCRVYQYLFKRSGETVTPQTYENPVVNAAIRNRAAFLSGKAQDLYSLDIYYAVVMDGPCSSFRVRSLRLLLTPKELLSSFPRFLIFPASPRAPVRAGGEQSPVPWRDGRKSSEPGEGFLPPRNF